MEQNQRTLVIGGVLAAAVILLAIFDGSSPLLIGVLVVVSALALYALYQQPAPAPTPEVEEEDEEEWVAEEEDWEADEADEDWEAPDEEESVDLSFVDEYVEEHPEPLLPTRADRGRAEEPDEEVGYEEYDEADGDDSVLVEEPDLDEEFEEAIAGYEEPSYDVDSDTLTAVEEEELLDDTGLIDEAKVTSDQAILGAAHVSSFTPDEEEANEETREILGRVAALLAKYE